MIRELAKRPRKAKRKNHARERPPRLPIPAYCWECSVLNSAHVTRFAGQIIDGGATRKRRAMPPMEKPICGAQPSGIVMIRDKCRSQSRKSRQDRFDGPVRAVKSVHEAREGLLLSEFATIS